MSTIFEELENLKPEEVGTHTQLSLEWFRTNIRRIFDRRNNEKVYLDGTKVGEIQEGNMYMMFYNAKTKKKLPWYDRFPLVIPFDKRSVENGFYGINLHYIPPLYRQNLLEEMYKYSKGEGVEIDYQYFRSVSRLRPAIPCVKRYLGDHVKSSTVRIDADEWEIAIFLPVERFQKESKKTVWADSRRYY